MPIQVPESTTGRTRYGGTGADVITTLDAEGDLVPYRTSMSAWDSPSGGVQITDLQDATGAAVSAVTQPASLDPIVFYGPPDYTGPIWVETTTTIDGNPHTTRWQIDPADLANRSGGGARWGEIPGQPPVVAAGQDAGSARAAVGAQSDAWVPTKAQVGLGAVDNTADSVKPVSGPQAGAISAAANQAETVARNRQNHTGTQLASTISNFESEVRRIVALINGTTPEPPPSTVTGAPLNVSASGSTAEPFTITIEWAAPTDTGGKTVSGYDVYRDNPDWNRGTLLPSTDRSFTFTNFVAGSTYKVGVQTVFTDGTKSPWVYASPVTFGSVTQPPPPTTEPPPVVTDPGGTTGTAPMAYPRHGISMYHMCWTNSGSPRLSTTPANVNNIRLAFMQGDPPSITGPASEGSMATFGAELKKLRARGVRIIASIGGAGGHVNIANRTGFVQGIMNFSNNVCPLDGIDWDLEGAAMGAADVRAVCVSLKQQRGANFAVTMAPNGSNIGEYLTVAQGLQADGNLSSFGQQFYDAAVSEGAMMGRLDEYVGRGLPISKYELGMMNPPGSVSGGYWDLATCVSRLNAAKAKYPTLGGAYYWEAGRAGAAQWASTIGNTIKTWA